MSRYISFFCGRFCHTAQNLKVYSTEREVRPGLDLQGNRLQYYRLNYSFNYYSPISKSDISRPSLGISSFLTLTWLGYSPKHPKAQHFQKLFHSCFFFSFFKLQGKACTGGYLNLLSIVSNKLFINHYNPLVLIFHIIIYFIYLIE
jgi:hypothetical protein